MQTNHRRRTMLGRVMMQGLEGRRMLAVGDLDPTFGSGAGYVYASDVNPDLLGYRLTFQPDGKLLVADFGTRVNGRYQTTLIRLNVDGTLDRSFAEQGVAIMSPPLETPTVGPVIVDPDGSIAMLSGIFSANAVLARVDANGAALPFGSESYLSLEGSMVSFSSNGRGKFYVAGTFNRPGAVGGGVYCVNSDGTPDLAFDGDGYVIPSVTLPAPDGDGGIFRMDSGVQDIEVSNSGDIYVGCTDTRSLGVFTNDERSGLIFHLKPDGQIAPAPTGSGKDVWFGFRHIKPGERTWMKQMISSQDGRVYAIFSRQTSTSTDLQTSGTAVELTASSPMSAAPAREIDALYNMTEIATLNGDLYGLRSYAYTALGTQTAIHGYRSSGNFQSVLPPFGNTSDLLTAYDLGNNRLAIAWFGTKADGFATPFVAIGRVMLDDTPIQSPVPTAPVSLKYTYGDGDNVVRLTWADATGERSYQIQRRYTGTTLWTTVGEAGADVEYYIDRTAYRNCTYEYRVVASNAVGQTPSQALKVSTHITFIQIPGNTSISGELFLDSNFSNRRDNNEPGVSGRRIYVDRNNDWTFDAYSEPSAVTAADGSFMISNVTGGILNVRLEEVDNYYQSTPGDNLPFVVSVSDGEAKSGLVFGTNVIPGITLTGASYGYVKAQGAAVAGVSVFADLNRDGILQPTEPVAKTNRKGRYSFGDDVSLSTRKQVKLVALAGHGLLAQDLGDGSARVFVDVNHSGTYTASRDRLLSRVSLFEDLDNDGVRDANERVFKTSKSGRITAGNVAIELALLRMM